MTIHSRAAWKARPPRDRTPQQLTSNSTLFVHWSTGQGLGPALDTWEEKCAAVRAVQNFHMDVRDWNDIGYGYVVVQPTKWWRRAHVFMGRGGDTVPASQAGHNTGHTSVCVLMREGEPLRKNTVRALKELYKSLPCGSVKGHRDVGATSCPGDLLYAALPEIRSAK